MCALGPLPHNLAPVRVLVVSHRYPPAYTAGTEVYSAQVAVGLVRRGHQVRVLCTEKDLARPDLSLSEREHEGVPVSELTNNLFLDDLRATWQRPEIDRLFGELLDRERPDLVHFMHLMYLSTGCVDEARARGIPVVLTMHDFYLACPRFGQLRHPDGSLCESIDLARCGGCMTTFKFAQSPLERATGRAIAVVHQATGLDLSEAARSAARLVSRGGGAPVVGDDPVRARELEGLLGERRAHMLRHLAPAVSRFIAPSAFLGGFMVRWGLPDAEVRVITTGIDRERYAPRTTVPGELQDGRPLRVLFLGTYAVHKGAHVLLDAWARLPSELRARGRLDLFGPPFRSDPGYLAKLERDARACGAHLGGALTREEVAPALRSADLLVVPSIWYENAPMVILESLAVRTPLAVSGLGGMAELVQPGRSGWHFETGDADSLAQVLADVLREPQQLARLFPPQAHERTFEDTLDDIEAVYAEVLGGASS